MKLNVLLVQTRLAWEDPAANRAHVDEVLQDAKSADLVVLPEMFSTGFSMNSAGFAEAMSGPTVAWLQRKAADLNTSICGSLMVVDRGQYLNRFLLAEPGGTLHQYDKRHLFRMSAENENYTAGRTRSTIELSGFQIFPQVCYDLRFPVFSRNILGNNLGYDLALYVANWPAARRQHWLALLRARAIENQAFVIGVNRIGTDGNGVDYVGDSVAFDYNGELLIDMANREALASVTLDKDALTAYREQFPAWKDRDGFHLDET